MHLFAKRQTYMTNQRSNSDDKCGDIGDDGDENAKQKNTQITKHYKF